MKIIQEMMFKKKFPNETFNPDDFNDWVNENTIEAYSILMQIAIEFEEENKILAQFDER